MGPKKTSSPSSQAPSVATGKSSVSAEQRAAINLDDPSLYINRELSWLEFNRRVLEEAQDPLTPPLKNLSLPPFSARTLTSTSWSASAGSSASSMRTSMASMRAAGRSGSSLTKSQKKFAALVAEQYRCIMEEVLPRLKKPGIFLHRIDELDKKEKQAARRILRGTGLPDSDAPCRRCGTPLSVPRQSPPQPFGRFQGSERNKGAASLRLRRSALHPAEACSVQMRKRRGTISSSSKTSFGEHIHRLFPGMEIKNIIAFRVTRNHDYDLHENEVMDLLKSVEAEIRDRSDKIAVRLEVEPGAPEEGRPSPRPAARRRGAVYL